MFSESYNVFDETRENQNIKDTKMYSYSHQSCFAESLGIWEILQQSIVCQVSHIAWGIYRGAVMRLILLMLWPNALTLLSDLLWPNVVIIETSVLAPQTDNWAGVCVIAALDWNEPNIFKLSPVLWRAEDLGVTMDHSRILYYLIYKTVVLRLVFIQLIKW